MKTKTLSPIMALLAVLVLPMASQADEQTDQIDAAFADFTAEGSPGAAVAVMRDGEMLYEHGYGLAQLEYGIPVTPETIFHVASVSKQFTAFAVVLLAQDGKLSLDDDIRKYLPELHDFGDVITIRHLMHHTSGLRDQWALVQAAGWRMDDVITTGDILKLMSQQRELNFKPGDAYLYCNTGFTLLGEIATRVSGKPFKEFCAERIFQPLGMTHTHFHDDHRHIVPNRAYSYGRLEDGGYEKLVLSYANAGATSLFTTPGDLLRWQHNFETGRVGGKQAIETMLQRGKLNDGREINYACGVGHGSYHGFKTVGHGGADAGFRSQLVWFPEQKLSVAVVSNLAQANPAQLARKVADLYLPEWQEESKPEPTAPDPNPAFDAYEGMYLHEESGQVYKLVYTDGVLKLALGLSTPVPLAPGSGSSFHPLDGSDEPQVALETDRKGKVKTLYVTTADAVRQPFHPVERPERSHDYLKQFVGRYYSPELDVTYTVTLDGRNLVMESRKRGPSVLTPQYLDGFAWDGPIVHFIRDKRGHPTGFRINSGRITNLWFEKSD
jgi:CubicO group peptidase (beta-lactamase class C family)